MELPGSWPIYPSRYVAVTSRLYIFIVIKIVTREALPWEALTRRQAFFYIVLGFVASISVALLEITYVPQEFKETDLHWSSYVVKTPGCKMPFYDAYHWTIKHSELKTTFNYDNYCASAARPNVVRQALDVFTLDEKVLEEHYKASANETVCYYQSVLRNMTASNPDEERPLGPRVRVVFGRPLRQEYIVITCEANGTHLFSEYFLVPVDKRDAGEALAPGQLNVLIVGLDATSRLNFNRRMSRTRRFLVYERGAYEFLMYNKVGLNSVPNVTPLLTGVSGEDVTRQLNGSYYGSVPAIWKVYTSLAYVTLYLEEMPNWATFTGNIYGFKEAPTGYYAHSMMLQMHHNTSDNMLRMGGRLKTKEVLRYVVLQGPLVRGVMDTTAVLFLSDHGMCHATFRTTEIVDEAAIFRGNMTDNMLIRVSLKTLPETHFNVYGCLPKASSLEMHIDFVDRVDSYANKTTCLNRSSWQKVCNCKDQA
ncbi:uncharacterized protein LOC142588907 [Dermacentor variabilis]|uniref:uncharacterized protein LOC142588907 n=1 Tax=Dermacentor variabilis TaxID=34621 RepID=UPI003F5C90AE